MKYCNLLNDAEIVDMEHWNRKPNYLKIEYHFLDIISSRRRPFPGRIEYHRAATRVRSCQVNLQSAITQDNDEGGEVPVLIFPFLLSGKPVSVEYFISSLCVNAFETCITRGTPIDDVYNVVWVVVAAAPAKVYTRSHGFHRFPRLNGSPNWNVP